jgi:hypothetical protein
MLAGQLPGPTLIPCCAMHWAAVTSMHLLNAPIGDVDG